MNGCLLTTEFLTCERETNYIYNALSEEHHNLADWRPPPSNVAERGAVGVELVGMWKKKKKKNEKKKKKKGLPIACKQASNFLFFLVFFFFFFL